MTRTLNLRHVPNLTVAELAALVNSHGPIHSLWLGPQFGGGNNDPVSSLLQLLAEIPEQLVQLDLDLTGLALPPMTTTDDDNDEAQHHHQDSHLSILSLLLHRLCQLQTLSLRCQGPQAVLAFAQALQSVVPSSVSQLQVLDFRGNHMGPSGAQALASVLSGGKRLPHLHHLILSWNSLTDECVQALTPSLHQIKTLDLSCNPALTNVSLNQHLYQALQSGASSSSCLEQLILFSCRQITQVSPAMVQWLCHRNYQLQQLNLQGTLCDLDSDDWEQVQFALLLNRCGREATLQQFSPAVLQPKKDATAKTPTAPTPVPHGTLWWTSSSTSRTFKKRRLLQRTAKTTDQSLLLDLFLHHNDHAGEGGEHNDFSVLYYFCRQTVHHWSQLNG